MERDFTLHRECPEVWYKPEHYPTFVDANFAMWTAFNRLVEMAKEIDYLESATCGETTALIKYKDGTYDRFVIKGVKENG